MDASSGAMFDVILLVGLVLAAWYGPRVVRDVMGKVPMARPESVRDRLDRGEDVLVLDVRNPGEFTGPHGHIPDAVNIPLGELSKKAGDPHAGLDEYKDVPVIAVCRTDSRSYTAARMLRQLGFRDVSCMRGGMSKWNRLGYPVRRLG